MTDYLARTALVSRDDDSPTAAATRAAGCSS